MAKLLNSESPIFRDLFFQWPGRRITERLYERILMIPVDKLLHRQIVELHLSICRVSEFSSSRVERLSY